MKRIFLPAIATIALSTLIVASCQKDAGNANIPVGSNPTAAQRTAYNSGGAHNALLRAYKARYGFSSISTPVSALAQLNLERNLLPVAIEAGVADSTIYLTPFGRPTLDSIMASGYFGTDSLLRNTNAVFAATSGHIRNSVMKTVISNIISSSLDGGEFMTYAHAQLDGLSGLNEDEQNSIEGYRSVLDSSYSYWTNNPPTAGRSIAEIAKADSYGFHVGFCAAIDDGYWYFATVSGQYFAAVASYNASR